MHHVRFHRPEGGHGQVPERSGIRTRQDGRRVPQGAGGRARRYRGDRRQEVRRRQGLQMRPGGRGTRDAVHRRSHENERRGQRRRERHRQEMHPATRGADHPSAQHPRREEDQVRIGDRERVPERAHEPSARGGHGHHRPQHRPHGEPLDLHRGVHYTQGGRHR